MYSTGNIANDTVMSLYADRRNYTYSGELLVMYIVVKSLPCTSENNIIVYTHYNSINFFKYCQFK